ncbi:hypothetical protein G443_002492 [Actinoalloteichus cyanogriseus DSM 43889]|uniref:Lipoprotein n=1 Tax=Actinoalloteichus caeruleus DSM 43889 TaxID=1120930 RepID=A0ABT1JIV7_ACTCY|nr:hypothetical protein [Actinoalloteichus caeruleus DSM 43889]
MKGHIMTATVVVGVLAFSAACAGAREPTSTERGGQASGTRVADAPPDLRWVPCDPTPHL